MIIGVDASRAGIVEKTGTETYSSELIKAMLALPEAKKHQWRLYNRENIPWKRFWTKGGLALEVLKRPPDVLFIPAHTLPLLRWPKIKTVVTIHGLEYEYLPEYYQFPQNLLLNRSTEYAVKYADKLIAVSKWTKNQLVERLGADPKKISVVYEGISQRLVEAKNRQFKSDYMRQIRHKYGLEKDYVLFVGTIQPRKNLVKLIEAFAKVKTDKQLVIVGKLGWMYEEILAAPKKLKVSNRIRFIGRVEDADLAAIYKDASLFILPSLMEGFGLPLLEAMNFGVPVICSDRGALPEVAGKAALVINPESVEQMAEAMSLVLTNQELKQGLIEVGFRRVAEFSWAKAARQTLAVLTEKW